MRIATMTFLVLLLAVIGCGGGSSSSSGGGHAAVDAKGSLKSSTGNLTENAGWLAVFTEKDTGISHVGEVGPGSKFDIKGLRPSLPMTVVLLNPEYVFKSVLTSPDETPGQIRQFFTMSGTSIPSLVEDGSVVRIADDTNITWLTDVATDSDFDGVPDGMEITPAALTLDGRSPPFNSPFKLQEAVDFDGDGQLNEVDADIDGDGIINWFDGDIDVDTVINMFDGDANGNNVEDYLEENSELYYKEGIKYFTVQVIQNVEAGALSTYLFFTTKLRAGADAVRILGPEKLFLGATLAAVDPETGFETTGAWDRSLFDDGLNGDGEEKDLVFSTKIALATGVVPTPGQVVFLQVQHGADEKTAKTQEFPYMFPEVETGVITGTGSGNTFTIAGTPFVDSKESANTEKLKLWTWSVHLKDAEGAKIYGSNQIEAATPTYTLPEGVVPVGSYTCNVVVQSSARIAGLPAWTIKSADFAVTTTQ